MSTYSLKKSTDCGTKGSDNDPCPVSETAPTNRTCLRAGLTVDVGVDQAWPGAAVHMHLPLAALVERRHSHALRLHLLWAAVRLADLVVPLFEMLRHVEDL